MAVCVLGIEQLKARSYSPSGIASWEVSNHVNALRYHGAKHYVNLEREIKINNADSFLYL